MDRLELPPGVRRHKPITPERIEFEYSIDDLEENEEIQTEHNLRASLSVEYLLDENGEEGSESDE